MPNARKARPWSTVYLSTSAGVITSAVGSRKPSKIAAPRSAGVRNGTPAARSYSRNQAATATAPASPTTIPSLMRLRLIDGLLSGSPARRVARAREPSVVHLVGAATLRVRLTNEEARHMPAMALVRAGVDGTRVESWPSARRNTHERSVHDSWNRSDHSGSHCL